MAKKRPNVIPIIEDARHPAKYRMLVPMVDVIFADVAQPDQVRVLPCYRALQVCSGSGCLVTCCDGLHVLRTALSGACASC